MNPGTWLHAVTDVLVMVLLFGAVPLAYLAGFARGQRRVDPFKKAVHDCRREQTGLKMPVFGACGVEQGPWACHRLAGHPGSHVHDKDGVTVAWSGGSSTIPKFVDTEEGTRD